MNDIIYSWEFSNDKKRGSMWYVIALSIIIGLVIFGFISRQYIMSFLILLITGVTFFVENNSEDSTKITLTQLGIKINNTFYDYPKIQSFSIIYDGEYASILRLIMIKKGIKVIDIDIDNSIVGDLRQILPNYIQEDENGELTFTDKLIKILKL